MFTQGRLAMPPVRRGCHGTRHFIFPECVAGLIRCEGTPLSFLRRVVGPRLMGRGRKEMKDDMRLKSVVVKNAGKPDSTVRTYGEIMVRNNLLLRQ